MKWISENKIIKLKKIGIVFLWVLLCSGLIILISINIIVLIYYKINNDDKIIQKYILSEKEYSGHYLCKNGKIIHSVIFEQKTKQYEIKRGALTN